MSIYKKGIIFIIYAISFKLVIAQAVSPQQIDALPPFKTVSLNGDWLLDNLQAISAVYKTDSDKTIVLSNGLISRSFRIAPYFGCFSFKNLMNSKEMLRAIQPEAAVTLNGKSYNIGGVKGQFEYAYLQKDWLSNFSNDRAAFQFTGFDVKNISPRFAWKAKRWPFNKNTSAPWPPKGKEIIFYFIAPPNSGLNVKVAIHYSLYDNLPLISKWLTIENNGINPIRVNAFKNEILSFVEEESVVGGKQNTLATPHIKVESDYAFNDMSSTYSDQTTNWLADPSYTSQVNYNRQTPCLLVSEPPIGPYYKIAPHQSFEGYHSFELLYDSYDKERCGLAERKMYRTIAPWITENPIFLHLTTSNPAKVKEAINQCAATGFEMVILSFGSGLNMEDTSIANIKKFKQLADYAHSKGIQLGGYSLFSSRSIDVADDVINPKTGKPGDAIFGSAPCLGSTWGIAYLKKLNTFISKTGFDLLEHDGPYPGDICASTTHPGHEGIKDSQWNQWW
ncbi:MAG: alpha-galactosidase, partial [Arachidicoccus sp.]